MEVENTEYEPEANEVGSDLKGVRTSREKGGMHSALAATGQFLLMQQETLRADTGGIKILYAIE